MILAAGDERGLSNDATLGPTCLRREVLWSWFAILPLSRLVVCRHYAASDPSPESNGATRMFDALQRHLKQYTHTRIRRAIIDRVIRRQ